MWKPATSGLVLALAFVLSWGAAPVWAENPPEEAPAVPAPGAKPDPFAKATFGPKTVDLGHDLSLELPEGFAIFEGPEARALMEKMGNPGRDNLLAIVTTRGGGWMVTVTYDEEGYVKDDDAEKLDANGLLESIRKGTAAANEIREKRGIPTIDVVGWDEPPRYERDVHHLVWAVRGRASEHDVVNFNTRVLGRRGVASLNLIDDPDGLPTSKPEAAKLLAATTFKTGSRYQDFEAKNDKVAEYGLAALIAGGAGAAALKIAKVGLLAKFSGKILALFIAFKKAIIAAALGVVGFLQKLTGRGKKNPPMAARETSDPSA